MNYEGDKPRMSKLTGINYHTWQIQVSEMLKAQGLYGAINEKFSKTLRQMSEEGSFRENNDDNLEDNQATRNMILDAKASALIMSSCSQEPLKRIITLETAQERWDTLKALYAPLVLQQLESKIQSFINYEPRQNTTIADISTDLSTLQSEIGAINPQERPTDTMKVSILYRAIRTLNTLYDPFIFQLSLARITQYEEVVSQLIEHERRIAENGKTMKGKFFSATTNRAKGIRDDKQQDRSQKRRFDGKCHNCGKIGHRKAECRSLAGRGTRASGGPLTTPNGGRGLSPEDFDKTSSYTSETSWMASITSSDPRYAPSS